MAAGESMLADFQLIAVIIARGGGLGQVDGFLTLVAGAFCAASGIQRCKLLEGGVGCYEFLQSRSSKEP